MSLVVAVVGPTATGKSDLGVNLATALGGEVVNADAFQLYTGMDIGTAKLMVSERQGIPHHLLDMVAVGQTVSAADYREWGREVLTQIADRERRAVVVGGSGLYVRALLDAMEFPGTDPEVRAELEARLEQYGPGILHAELATKDPQAAEKIDRRNGRRVVRALEVYALTGAVSTGHLPEYRYEIPAVQIGLELDRESLDAAITARVESMWAHGLVDEVRQLLAAGMSVTAARAVGYSQAVAVVEGRLSEEEAKHDTVIATRRLARKQMGWFGRDPRVHWLSADSPDVVEQALEVVAAADRGESDFDPTPTRRALPSVS